MRTILRVVVIAGVVLLGTTKCDSAGRPSGRYQVVYGLIGGYTRSDGQQFGAFVRIDTVTGQTWIYRGEITGWLPIDEHRIGDWRDLPTRK
ncbi:MAG TPA: hypothetical protein VGQ81_14680 [Acidobacteriota bacterium]|jgi:hypothetical protein|nr:hypothetical protein [Acidobacteriota bacterium]